MDAHVFRLLSLDLLKLLEGARVEKIHAPAEDITVFTIFALGKKHRLVLYCNRRSPALYLSERTLPNPREPGTPVMRLRKYLAGKKLASLRPDWINRRLACPLPPQPPENASKPFHSAPGAFILDMVEGPALAASMPEFTPAAWPPRELTASLCRREKTPEANEAPTAGLEDSCGYSPENFTENSFNAWKNYPALTPLLRKTLSCLEPQEGLSLLADLEYESERGLGSLHIYAPGGKPPVLSAWPLPEELIPPGSELTVIGQGDEEGDPAVHLPFLTACGAVYERPVLASLGSSLSQEERQTRKISVKHYERLLKKLAEEEKRLNEMLELRSTAVLLQENLWRFSREEKLAEIELERPDGSSRRIALNPLFSIRRNMAEMFRQSDRGARGLNILQERRNAALHDLELARSGMPTQAEERKAAVKKPLNSSPSAREEQKKRKAADKLIQRFQSSDGFLLLRGRSAQGNQALLKMSMPHDLWFHAADGPSAHVVCRRGSAAVDVPEQTLREAGALAGLKSPQREAGKAEIMCALVKDVQPIKGAAAGTVRVNRAQPGLRVTLDPELEQKLLPREPG